MTTDSVFYKSWSALTLFEFRKKLLRFIFKNRDIVLKSFFSSKPSLHYWADGFMLFIHQVFCFRQYSPGEAYGLETQIARWPTRADSGDVLKHPLRTARHHPNVFALNPQQHPCTNPTRPVHFNSAELNKTRPNVLLI
jgi:hypothetical protein